MTTLKSIKAAMLADRETRAEYEALADEFEMVRELIAARSVAGITQEQVAQAIGARAVVRLEAAKPRRGRKAAA